MVLRSTASVYDYVGRGLRSANPTVCEDYQFVPSSNSIVWTQIDLTTFNVIRTGTLSSVFSGSITGTYSVIKKGRFFYIAAIMSTTGNGIQVAKFDPETSTIVGVVTLDITGTTSSMVWSSTGTYLLVGRSNSNGALLYKFDANTFTFTSIPFTVASPVATFSGVSISPDEKIIFIWQKSTTSGTTARVFTLENDVVTERTASDYIQNHGNIIGIEFNPSSDCFLVARGNSSGVPYTAALYFYKKTGPNAFTQQALTGVDFSDATDSLANISWTHPRAFSLVTYGLQAYVYSINTATNTVARVKTITGLTKSVNPTAFSKIPGIPNSVAWRQVITVGSVSLTMYVGMIETDVQQKNVPDLTGTSNFYVAGASTSAAPRSMSMDGKIICAGPASGTFSPKIRRGNNYVDSSLVFNASINQYPSVSPDGRYLVVKNAANNALELYRFDRDLDDFVLINDTWVTGFTGTVNNASNFIVSWSWSGKKVAVWGSNIGFMRVLRFAETNPSVAVSTTSQVFDLRFSEENFYYKDAANSRTVIVAPYNPNTDAYGGRATVSIDNTLHTNALMAGIFLPVWNTGSSGNYALFYSGSTWSLVAGLLPLLGMDTTATNYNVSPNGRYIIIQNSSNQYKVYDTTTFPFLEITNGYVASATGTTTSQPFINNDASFIIVGSTGIVRQSPNYVTETFPRYGIAGQTQGKPMIEGSLEYPKFSASALAKYTERLVGSASYPKFGIAGALKRPEIISGNLGFPTYRVNSVVITTEYEPVVAYDLAIQTSTYKINEKTVNFTTVEVPYITSEINYPKYGISSLGASPYDVNGSPRYPTFNIAGETYSPIAVLGSPTFPKFGIGGTVLITEYEPVIAYDLALTSSDLKINGKSQNISIVPGGTYGFTNLIYPKFGTDGYVKKREDFIGYFNYPAFGIEAQALIPERLEVAYSFPAYSLSVMTARTVEGILRYPTFGTDGLVGVAEGAIGEMTYPSYGLWSTVGFNGLEGELVYPSYGLEVIAQVKPQEYDGELVYPTYGAEAAVDLYNSVRSEYTFPIFGAEGEVRVPTAAFIGLFYPSMGFEGEVSVPEYYYGNYTFPKFGTDGLVNVPETAYGNIAYPIFGFAGTVRVPETAYGLLGYPKFGTDGLINVPIALMGRFEYPSYGTEGYIQPTYKISSEVKYPRFSIQGLSGYPDQIDSNMRFPVFGVRVVIKGGSDIEGSMKYPAFGGSGELELYYALNVDATIGDMSVASELGADKATRRSIIIRR